MVEIYIEKEDCNIMRGIQSELTDVREIDIIVDKDGKLVGVRVIGGNRKNREEEFSIENGNKVYFDNFTDYECLD